MRKILSLCFFSLALPFAVQAQIAPADKVAPKDTPKKEAPKTQAKKQANKSIDLDAYFKNGEKNAEEGARCNAPTAPTEPIV